MPLSTKRIADTINWAKRMSFNRNPVIGNSLEPALTSAQMVMQTLLSPPFDWWWNSEEIVFNTNATANSATVTNIGIAGGVLTVTAANTFSKGNLVIGSAIGTYTALNGFLLEILAASPTQFTANVPFANYGPAADTGTMTNTTTQDYTVAAPEFSHIEHASVYDPSSTPPTWFELTVKNNLSLDSSTARPEFLSPEVEDGNGNMTFRVQPAPDKSYPISIHVQLAAPEITSINQTWAPLPDFMQYIYDWGFLALIWHFADDPRAAVANQKFLAGILGRAEGLTEQERNIFLNAWSGLTGLQNMTMQQGRQALGV